MLKIIKVTFIKQKSLDELPEYSCTIPTGKIIGKKWKRDINFSLYGQKRGTTLPDWYVCEYVKHEDPGLIGITHKKAIII